jgi:predicted cobalt transporter CbtA
MVGRPQFMRGLTKLFAALIVGAFMALPAGAIAQSSEGGYNQPGGVVQDQIQTQPAQAQSDNTTPPAATAAAPAAASDEGGQLPFTGFDLALVVAAGGVLLLLGFGIRRFTRPTEVV